MTIAHELAAAGQAVWLDFIRRSFLTDGGLQRAIDDGVRGVTSNPTIFEKAIAGSTDYDADFKALAYAGKSVDEIYEALALEDIARAADLLRPVYDATDGLDGYISLEVSPRLAHNTAQTIADARRYFAALNRPNVMIKVPATPEGIPAIETLIADGININVTLIFSIAQYTDVINAYITGLEKLAAGGGDVKKVASVASFFVSRVDSAVDKLLEGLGETGKPLLGKIAIANAQAAYALFYNKFNEARWNALAAKGARVQRPLWASTGTKNPNYPDTLYVDHLVAPHTVNTMPPATLQAVLDHGSAKVALKNTADEAEAQLKQLAALGIDLDAVIEKLLADGVKIFADSFVSLMSSIAQKRDLIRAGFMGFEAALGTYEAAVMQAVGEIRDQNILSRIWAGDHMVWKPDPTEISNRLGWLRISDMMQANLHRMEALANAVRHEGYTHAVLLGMGGSSLAPEVFRKTFGVKDGYLDLLVLDSTDPGMILNYERQLDFNKTLFIVSTKSGGTVETFSFFKYFYTRTVEFLGREHAGKHFIAITDPGSKIEEIADQYHFRATFLNDPNIGGRYSALSYFGLVPAALLGVDLKALLDRADHMELSCDANNCASDGDNVGGRLGAILGTLAKHGRDKVTFVLSPTIASFGDWVEQLIAESTGKEGKGILPVVGETLGNPDVYSDDRVFVQLKLQDDTTTAHDTALKALQTAGHPVVRLRLNDAYDLGGQFFLWEMATAVAGQQLGINPFDQPNVESAKVLARKMVAAYQQEGKLPELTPTLKSSGVTVYGDVVAPTAAEVLKQFVASRGKGAYVALQAYLTPSERTENALQTLRIYLRDHYQVATTVGYGPRFLHSTGQLHKGDAGNGLFIIFTADAPEDLPIPDEAGEAKSSMSFATLKMAQALGDRQALLDNGRKVLMLHLSNNIEDSLRTLN